MSSPIIEKIKKLLRLGRDKGATPAEAAVALQKAQDLAAEHGVDLGALSPDQDGTGGMSHATENSTKGPAQIHASQLVKRHFNVATLFDSTGPKRVIHFIGVETNCQIAAYVYIYVVRAANQAWRNRANKRLRDRRAFIIGFIAAIDRMMPEKFHQPGLVVVADRYIEGVILTGKTGIKITDVKGPKKPLSDKAFRDGFIEGTGAGINNALRGTKPLNLS
jgi:hypothetical protein